MYSLREAILRNCYIGSLPNYGEFTITENAGYVVFNWPDGKTTRMRRAANGVDTLVPLPDGSTLRIKMSVGLY
ncbi:hypothetical protein FWF89_03460 [Candidatus Saccharibacteria bacterium]|nr:hypothetical protein [Candidatus Saccharibacteria bacterium]